MGNNKFFKFIRNTKFFKFIRTKLNLLIFPRKILLINQKLIKSCLPKIDEKIIIFLDNYFVFVVIYVVFRRYNTWFCLFDVFFLLTFLYISLKSLIFFIFFCVAIYVIFHGWGRKAELVIYFPALHAIALIWILTVVLVGSLSFCFTVLYDVVFFWILVVGRAGIL